MRISLPIAALAMVAIGLSPVVHADEEPSDEIQEFPARPAGEIDASEEAIARDIELLGADEGAVREAATLRLFWIGEPARAALTAARETADAEVCDRAGRVLRMLDRLAALTEVNVRFKVRGYCHAGTRKTDPNAAGGFGPSKNLPRPLTPEIAAEAGAVQVVAEPDTLTVFGKSHRGMRVLLVNATDAGAWFDASDSRIAVLQEAQDEDGQWKPIEYLPQSW